jgi:kinesin family protein 6/9
MSKNAAIEIFLRVRPTKRKSDKFHSITEDAKAVFTDLKQMKKGEYVNNTRNEYSYCFNGLFGMETKQEEVFERVAKDVLDAAFDGYNGTIFAYGQTGSGKTFTMTGERYADRGLIPRSISYIFSEANRRSDTEFSIQISYLEIYNNDGYDLLSEEHSNQYKELTDLPRVVPMERSTGDLVLSGLSSHRVGKEEDALNLLFIGDTNRAVCETPMNDASTRSHCIFIITIESRKLDSDVKSVSKVHLVDLSGSERVGKTGVNGVLLKEACSINLSLHYLEQVINSLQKKMNSNDPDQYFVPYRNSLMTMVLRDSLGGNCKTKMISTIHVEDDYLDESISTCNFAMRVAMIKNTVVRNEAVDPSIIISRLKRENQELRAEIALLKGTSAKMELTGEDKARCSKIVQEFVAAKDPTQKIILSDPLMITQCFSELKLLLLSRPAEPAQVKVKEVFKEDTERVKRLEEELARLKLVLKQRENEILIFLNMLNKKAEHPEALDKPERDSTPPKTSREKRDEELKQNIMNLRETQEMKFPNYSKKEEDKNYQMVYSVVKADGSMTDFKSSDKPESRGGTSKQSQVQKTTAATSQAPPVQSKEMAEINKMLIHPVALSRADLMDRQRSFEAFRSSYRKSEGIEEYQRMLRELGDRGKGEAEIVRRCKDNIDRLKGMIEDARRVQALQGMKVGGGWTRSEEEERLMGEMEGEKKRLTGSFEKVKEIKAEIDRVKTHCENAMKRLNEDFKRWVGQMMLEQGIGDSTVNESDQNASHISKTAQIKNPKVKQDLEEFFKAKEEINRKINAGLSGN